MNGFQNLFDFPDVAEAHTFKDSLGTEAFILR
jgi:hypothetical protein